MSPDGPSRLVSPCRIARDERPGHRPAGRADTQAVQTELTATYGAWVRPALDEDTNKPSQQSPTGNEVPHLGPGPHRLDVLLDVRRSLLVLQCPADGDQVRQNGAGSAAQLDAFSRAHLSCAAQHQGPDLADQLPTAHATTWASA